MTIRKGDKLIACNYSSNAANIDLSNLSDTGKQLFDSKANTNLDNLSKEALEVLKGLSSNGLEIGDIGIAPLGIDETQNKRRLLNGQTIIQDQFVSFTTKLKKAVELYPSIACTEEEWQATVTMSTLGQCGKFVIDDEVGTIRLPKIIMPIQGLTDLSKLGEIVEAGLPNITGSANIGYLGGTSWGQIVTQTSGALKATSTSTTQGSYSTSVSANQPTGLNLDASLSNNIYGNSNTVQQEQIQYPYFIQVANGVGESVDVTREIELNNPFFFGYYQYFEIAPNNISWLKSEGQWNSKVIYTDYYDWILTSANDGVENFKLSTDTYDDYCWVINTADETFRLPIKTKNAPFEVTGAKTTLSMGAVSVYGNGKALGITDGSTHFAFGKSSTNTVFISTADFGGNAGADVSDNNASSSVNKAWGVVADASKSGLTGSVSGTATTSVTTADNTNVSLYFYVGETVQNANILNLGRIQETMITDIARIEDTIASNVEQLETAIDTKVDKSSIRYDSSTATLYIGV